MSNYSEVVPIVTDLFFAANPAMYNPGYCVGKGIALRVGEGAGELSFCITGYSKFLGIKLCTYALDSDAVNIGPDVFAIGELTTHPDLLYIETNRFGRELHGGKTLYSIDIDGHGQRELLVSVYRRFTYADDFEEFVKAYALVDYGRFRAPVAGVEFKVVLSLLPKALEKKFELTKLITWIKVTDRRGFNTSPGILGIQPK